MARKRMIDPKFWTDDKVMELPYPGRLLLIGIWNFADDTGIHINNSKVLKAEIFPGDEITIDEIDQIKVYLIELGIIVLNNDKSLLKVKNWDLYQTISHPQPSKYEFITEELHTDSVNVPRIGREDSENTNGILLPNIIESNIVKDNIKKDKKKIVPKVKKPSGPKPYPEKVNKFFKEIDDEYINLLKESFPNVDINQELRAAKAWLLSNTDKAKSRFKPFITRWMNTQMERPNFNKSNTTIIDTTSEKIAKKEQIKRKKYQQEAIENAASQEEYTSILQDTVESLRANKKERLKNVTNN